MVLPKPDFNWGNLWADLLKGVGRGLLVHDGSRLSQAALAGLEVFDDAQERRRHHEREKPNGDAYPDALLRLLATMSPEELAALQRVRPEERAWKEEWAEQSDDDARSAGNGYPSIGIPQPPALEKTLPYQKNRPLSANPIDGWRLRPILPFGPDGALRSPIYRR